MNVAISADAYQCLVSLVNAGKYTSPEAAVEDGVRMLMAREQLRQEIQVGLNDANGGRMQEHDDLFARLRSLAVQMNRPGNAQ